MPPERHQAPVVMTPHQLDVAMQLVRVISNVGIPKPNAKSYKVGTRVCRVIKRTDHRFQSNA